MNKGTDLLDHYVNRIMNENLKSLLISRTNFKMLYEEFTSLQRFAYNVTEDKDYVSLMIRGCNVCMDDNIGLVSNGKTVAELWETIKEYSETLVGILQEYDEEYGNVHVGTLPFVPIIRVYCALAYCHKPDVKLMELMRKTAEIKETENG